MDDRTSSRTAQRVSIPQLRYVAAGLAYVVAALHLFHPTLGFGRLVLLLTSDPGLLASEPRPVLFVLAGLALLIAVPAAAVGVPNRPLYALGLGLMVAFVGGYFAWHFSGHGGFLPGREPLYHGLAPHEAVISHLTGDPWAAVAVVLELVLAGVLVRLLSRDR